MLSFKRSREVERDKRATDRGEWWTATKQELGLESRRKGGIKTRL